MALGKSQSFAVWVFLASPFLEHVHEKKDRAFQKKSKVLQVALSQTTQALHFLNSKTLNPKSHVILHHLAAQQYHNHRY